jgi:hypothetical protein
MTHISITPIQVKVLAGGGLKKASTVHDLKMILLHYWPVTDGPSFVNALVACQEALDGGKSVEKAREAFFMAAREADVAVVGE